MTEIFWCCLIILIGRTFLKRSERLRALSRDRENWVIDLVSLMIHLWGLPLLQATVLLKVLQWLAPQFRGSVSMGAVGALVLYIALDYLWSHAFEIYMWFIAGAVFVLRDPNWFLVYVIIGSIINFWGHTTIRRDSYVYRWISKVFITPHEHHWHHSTTHSNKNYATVFSFWDRMHGTFYTPTNVPETYGNDYLSGAFRQLLVPVPPLVGAVHASGGAPDGPHLIKLPKSRRWRV